MTEKLKNSRNGKMVLGASANKYTTAIFINVLYPSSEVLIYRILYILPLFFKNYIFLFLFIKTYIVTSLTCFFNDGINKNIYSYKTKTKMFHLFVDISYVEDSNLFLKWVWSRKSAMVVCRLYQPTANIECLEFKCYLAFYVLH